MNHAHLRQALVEQSGYAALVTDAAAGNYANKSGLMTNATYYLNAGIRWLDRRWSLTGTMRRRLYSVIADQWNFAIPNTDFIRRIDLTTSAGVVSRLQQKTYQWLRDYYGKEWAEVDSAKPLYWAIVPESEDIGELLDANFLTEPIIMDDDDAEIDNWKAAMLANPNKWVALQSNQWSWASGTLSWDKEALDETSCAVGSYIGRYIDATIVVDLDITVTTGSITFALIDYDGTEYTAVSDIQTVTGSGDFELSATAPWNVIAIGFGARTDAGEGSVSRVSIAEKRPYNIVTMPPSDTTYSLNVFGDFTNIALEGDIDTNFWTDTHPELVVRAARVQLEMDGHRNVSGLEGFQQQVEQEVQRMLAEDRFAHISGLTPREAVQNG